MELIRELRENKGLSRRELAQLADISPAFLAEIERGSRGPSAKTLSALAEALGEREKLFKEFNLIDPKLEELLKESGVYRFLSQLTQLDKQKRDSFLTMTQKLL